VRILRYIAEVLGTAGVLGIGVLLFCALFYFSGVRALERELRAQQAAAEQVKVRPTLQHVAARDRAEELRRFYSLFPPLDRLPNELERVYALARGADLQLQQSEYRLEARGGLAAYRVTFPARGTYAQLRKFVSATLQEMPVAALDTLRFERKRAGDAMLEAQLRLTIYFRPDGEETYRSSTETEEAR
jgi:hypothetical protein